MKKLGKLILAVILLTAITAQSAVQKSLRDGTVIDGVDGVLSQKNLSWFFSPFDSLTDGRGIIKPGSKIKILTSSILEKLDNAAKGENKNYRIWGKFTKHANKNYIYLSYFLPIAEVKTTEQPQFDADPNEEKIIPDDVMAMLKPQRKVNLAELKKPLATKADGVLVDRTGFLKKTDGNYYFDFDAVGRKIDNLSLPLLKCSILDLMEAKQRISARPLMFKISAIATSYKGQNYLLLQRATRVYNRGNFDR